MVDAWIAMRTLRWIRTYGTDLTASAMERTDSPNRPPAPLAFREPRLFEDVLALAEREARDRAEQYRAQYVDRRQAVADGQDG